MKDLKDRYPSSSSWENIEPRFNLTEREPDEQETMALRRKIDELQDRVKEVSLAFTWLSEDHLCC